jgi:hypothetical protein
VNQVDRSRPLGVRRQAVLDSFRKSITDLLATGKKVLLVYPVPEVGWNVPEYASKKYRYVGDTSVTTDYQRYLERNRDVIKMFDGLGDMRNLVRIRPDRVFCDHWVKQRCVASHKGDLLYVDDDHLSYSGARYLVEQIAANL